MKFWRKIAQLLVVVEKLSFFESAILKKILQKKIGFFHENQSTFIG
jgi:hypothetical protein